MLISLDMPLSNSNGYSRVKKFLRLRRAVNLLFNYAVFVQMLFIGRLGQGKITLYSSLKFSWPAAA